MFRTVIGCAGCFSSTCSLSCSTASHLVLELRQVFFHRVVDVHLAFVHQHHQRRGGDRLATARRSRTGSPLASAFSPRCRRSRPFPGPASCPWRPPASPRPARLWLSTNGCSMSGDAAVGRLRFLRRNRQQNGEQQGSKFNSKRAHGAMVTLWLAIESRPAHMLL